jgi:N-carbamoyl-L-amino-acid hydrolase
MASFDMDTLRVNEQRLWESLMEMAEIGATEKGGVCRLALSEVDSRGRALLARWCQEEGCTVTVDQVGNLYARRPGRREDLAAVGTGSHLDTQPTGGKFDGAYGVLAGLEVIRTLNDSGVDTQAPVELVMWTNEEGARFAPAMLGSGVFAGVFGVEEAWSRRDRDGTTVGEALDAIGYRGEETPGDRAYGAFFEVHIEQGPILEVEQKTIGIVTGVQGTRWYDVTLLGEEAHAGPTPMERRRDALAGVAELLPRIYGLALDRRPHGRVTVTGLRTTPDSRNTVPGSCHCAVDLRHPNLEELAAMDAGLKAAVVEVAQGRGLHHSVVDIWCSAPVAFDSDCVAAVRRGAERMGYPAIEIVSGAGHDSVYVSRVAPTAMIFIPCEGGISHNETENATPQDVAAGANVLLHAVLERAKRVGS